MRIDPFMLRWLPAVGCGFLLVLWGVVLSWRVRWLRARILELERKRKLGEVTEWGSE